MAEVSGGNKDRRGLGGGGPWAGAVALAAGYRGCPACPACPASGQMQISEGGGGPSLGQGQGPGRCGCAGSYLLYLRPAAAGFWPRRRQQGQDPR